MVEVEGELDFWGYMPLLTDRTPSAAGPPPPIALLTCRCHLEDYLIFEALVVAETSLDGNIHLKFRARYRYVTCLICQAKVAQAEHSPVSVPLSSADVVALVAVVEEWPEKSGWLEILG